LRRTIRVPLVRPTLHLPLSGRAERISRDRAHDVRRIAIPRCGHVPHEERPDVVNLELLAFLDGCSRC
jgi:pimeloyl-ACP methyl ester carboxylesterase